MRPGKPFSSAWRGSRGMAITQKEDVMAQRKDITLEEELSVIGRSLEIYKILLQAVKKRGGMRDDMKRILNETALQDTIAGLIVPADVADRPLGGTEYVVPVTYDMPRDKAALEAQISKNGVSDLFYGDYEWQNHASCAGIVQTPGPKNMLLKQFTPKEIKEMGGLESENIIAYMDARGYRPATHLETYAFGVNPETSGLQREFWIIGLGSFALVGGGRCAAVLRAGGGRRILGYGWFGYAWDAHDRFLFVRKPA
jgi:hypothetical protein